MKESRIVIDTDPGVDDAIAILMALACPKFEIVGLTTVGGNVPLARGTRNALALLEYAGREDIPVAAGAARPYRGRFRHSYRFHTPTGIGRRLPDPKTRPVDIGAVEFLAGALDHAPGGLTIIALGPLTNLALLLDQYPESLERLNSLVVMGGAVDVPGNTTASAEFNIHSDANAANLVLSRVSPITLIELGACRQAAITREDAGTLQSNDRLGRLALQILANWFGRDEGRQRFEFYDPLTVAAAINPEVITVRKTGLRVELEDPELFGATLPHDGNPEVAVSGEVDSARFFGLLEELLGLRKRDPDQAGPGPPRICRKSGS